MKLLDVTPLILTYNEAANLRTTLNGVSWAQRIVVIDSGSSDDTLKIAAEFPQVSVYYREFDHFAEQCNFGLAQINSLWALSLDADYRCPAELADEIAGLDDSCGGYRATFQYCVYGRPLRKTLYPRRIVLYRTEAAVYLRDGHAHRVRVAGTIGDLKTRILHDDWKPLSSWFGSQLKYADLEADKLYGTPKAKLGWKDRVRTKIVLAPPLTLFYCLFYKLLILDGWAGIYYTMQRVLAELLLSLTLLDRKLRK